jgi:site-specific recombinase XerD
MACKTAKPAMEPPPAWLQPFLDRLAAEDLAAATRRGYRYDLLRFITWYAGLIAWRQHMLTQGGLKATSINRRLEAVRHLLRWAEANGAVPRNVALHVRSVRVSRERQPLGLTPAEVHGLLRAAGASSHGLARRNYAPVQLMLQTGLRVGEVAALRRRDIALRDRAGTVRVRSGKGLKEREVPLNATARRALRQLLAQEPATPSDAAVFRSGRNAAMPVRSIQNVIAALVRRAGLARPGITAHSLRHTFARLAAPASGPAGRAGAAAGPREPRHHRRLHPRLGRGPGARRRAGAVQPRRLTCRRAPRATRPIPIRCCATGR